MNAHKAVNRLEDLIIVTKDLVDLIKEGVEVVEFDGDRIVMKYDRLKFSLSLEKGRWVLDSIFLSQNN